MTETTVSPEDRAALLKLHEWDELIFGGFICTHCTDDDELDAVAWPCDPLTAAGVTLYEAELLIRVRRLEIELKHARTTARALQEQVSAVTR